MFVVASNCLVLLLRIDFASSAELPYSDAFSLCLDRVSLSARGKSGHPKCRIEAKPSASASFLKGVPLQEAAGLEPELLLQLRAASTFGRCCLAGPSDSDFECPFLSRPEEHNLE